MKVATPSNFEKIYDNYCGLIYGIALKISPNQNQAEEILIKTFIQAELQNIDEQESTTIYLALIKIIIQTAHHELNNSTGKTNIKLVKFENFPLIHQILCEQTCLDCFAKENSLTKVATGKMLYNEFELLKYLYHQYSTPVLKGATYNNTILKSLAK